jgi:hypothetical protein
MAAVAVGVDHTAAAHAEHAAVAAAAPV